MSSRHTSCFLAVFAIALCILCHPLSAQSDSLGIFEGQSDVGSVVPPGTLAYDKAAGTYTITSAGVNIWGVTDGFHFVWKKLSGDFSLTANITFAPAQANSIPHRKVVLMARQTLDPDSPHVAAGQHGNGLTALQYRREKGGITPGIELNIDPPQRLRLEKRGETFTMFLSNHGEPLHQCGASIKLHLAEPFYAGIGLTSHDTAITEKATLSNVELKQLAPAATPSNLVLSSTLQAEEADFDTRRSTMVYTQRAHFEAPVWTRDGKSLIFDQDGRMYTIPASGGTPQLIDVGNATDCTGSHGVSPDGKWLAITCVTPGHPEHRVYIVPIGGGTPRMVTEHPDSWFHGWSPDGKTIAFTRPDHGSGNIYAISVDGGPERALTTDKGISDDPDYSADGKYIYFNSDRTGFFEIWRMNADGSEPRQITFDKEDNWTPHPSPDGKSIAFLAFGKGATGHKSNKDVAIRILSLDDNKNRVLVNFVGGAGSMNVPFWSPDSKRLAFVSYQMLPAEDTGSTE